MSKPLANYLSPDLSEARLARQYGNILEQTKRGSRLSRWSVLALAGALGAAGLLAVILFFSPPRPPAPSPLDGTIAESRAGGELLTLPEGTRMRLDAQTRMRMTTVHANLVRVALEAGGVDFDVAHVDGRRFLIDAAGYEVSVVGTHFTVRLLSEGGQTKLEVKVERGRVRVAREGHPELERFLGAGESWSNLIGEAAAPAAPVALPDIEESNDAPPRAPLAIPNVPPRVLVPSSASEGPKELLARAEGAAASGHPREAAVALDSLRSRFRGDSRAGLAAFELGRVRLDTLKDPAGALEAFDDALVLAPNAPFREDAEARRVQALERLDAARCAQARSSYLARYPQGVHRVDVSRRCGP